MGIQNYREEEQVSFRERKLSRVQSAQTTQNTRKAQANHLRNELDAETTEPMALSAEAKDWLQRNWLEGFI